jgi:uncharacterized membrane protein
MVLAKDEVLIKDWNYASGKTGLLFGLHTEAKIAVTNKRVIYTAENERKIARQEIPLKAAKSVYSSHETVSKLGAILLMLLGVVLAIAGIVLLFAKGIFPILGVVALVLGAVVVWLGYTRLNQGAFSLTITTCGIEGESMAVSASRMLGKRQAPVMKVKIHNDIAREIVEEIGAIIAENR